MCVIFVYVCMRIYSVCVSVCENCESVNYKLSPLTAITTNQFLHHNTTITTTSHHHHHTPSSHTHIILTYHMCSTYVSALLKRRKLSLASRAFLSLFPLRRTNSSLQFFHRCPTASPDRHYVRLCVVDVQGNLSIRI